MDSCICSEGIRFLEACLQAAVDAGNGVRLAGDRL
jgi:hypothetical protein